MRIVLNLKTYIPDQAKLRQYSDDGYVYEKFHKTLPLKLLTYGRKAMYDQVWDEITEKCRGLIINVETDEIIARPFEKFHNFGTGTKPETLLENLPKENPIITKKLDGSLGILYYYDGKPYIASKGSFHSDHAEWATKYYNEHYGNAVWPLGFTPVFEMICENVQHHVIHYGEDGLHLLGLVFNETGEELDYTHLLQWGHSNQIPVVDRFHFKISEVLEHNKENEEGYVLSYPRVGTTPLRVKVKFVDFLRLQRMLNHVRPIDILDVLRYPHLSMYMDEYLNHSTPYFSAYASEWINKLTEMFALYCKEAQEIFKKAQSLDVGELQWTRKDYALFFTRPENSKYQHICFAMLDGQTDRATELTWKLVEPLTKDYKPLLEDFSS